MDPFTLDPDSLAVETFETEDPAGEPSQIMIVSTDNIIDCGTRMSNMPGF